MKLISFNLHHARLRLTDPVREQGDEHGMGQCFRLLVYVKLAGIRNVSGGFPSVIVICSLEPIPRGKRLAVRLTQLRRHVAIRRVHDDAHGLLAHGIERRRAVHGSFFIRNQVPRSNELFTKSLRHDAFSFKWWCYEALSAPLSIGMTWPEMDLPASDARKTHSAAMSFGSTNRLSVGMLTIDALSSSTVLPSAFARPANTFSIPWPPTAPGA